MTLAEALDELPGGFAWRELPCEHQRAESLPFGGKLRSPQAFPQRALDFDLRFHDAVAAASGNRRLRQEIAKYRLLVRAFCRMTGNSENLREALKEHQAVLKALGERQPAAAGQAMAQQVQKRVDAVLGSLYREAQ